jgi:hypothetical protein
VPVGIVGSVNLNLVGSVPEGLTRRARSFVSSDGVRADLPDAEQHRSFWEERGIPVTEIDRVVAFQRRWGGLVLPPAPEHDGGPRYFDVDTPDCSPATAMNGSVVNGWWFEAGSQRTAVPYLFMIGPAGEFGIHAQRWVPLHASVEGWIEALALAHHARRWAKQIRKVTGEAVDALNLDDFQPVPEVQGLADNWWRGTDSLIAIYVGDGACEGAPDFRTAWVYSGLDEWGLYGGVK